MFTYNKRNWINDADVINNKGAIFTDIEEFEDKHVATFSLTKNGGIFSASFDIADDYSKEATMKALSTIIKDLEELRNKVIQVKLEPAPPIIEE